MKIVLFAAFIVLVGIWVYQLVSGKLIGQSFKVFKTREQAPIYFGATLALEGVILLAGVIYIVGALIESKH